MKWDDMPEEIIKLILHHRSLKMACNFLDKELTKHNKGFVCDNLKHIHSAYKILRPNPRYDKMISCLLNEHDIWVHYYACIS